MNFERMAGPFPIPTAPTRPGGGTSGAPSSRITGVSVAVWKPLVSVLVLVVTIWPGNLLVAGMRIVLLLLSLSLQTSVSLVGNCSCELTPCLAPGAAALALLIMMLLIEGGNGGHGQGSPGLELPR